MTSAKRRRHKGIGLITPAPSCQALVPGFQASRGNGYIILVGWDDFQKCMDGLFYSDYGWDDFRFFLRNSPKCVCSPMFKAQNGLLPSKCWSALPAMCQWNQFWGASVRKWWKVSSAPNFYPKAAWIARSARAWNLGVRPSCCQHSACRCSQSFFAVRGHPEKNWIQKPVKC